MIIFQEEYAMTQPESIIFLDDEYTFNEKLNRISRTRNQQRVRDRFSSPSWKGEGIIEKINYFFNKEKVNASKEFEFYSKLVKRQPNNAKVHLKLGTLFQKRKDHQKAVAEYLRAAEIFCMNNLFPQAMAIYKQVLKQNHGLDQVHLRIADIYRRMGFLGDAFYRYNLLLQHYNIYGEKEKAMEVMGLMAELDPRKFNLREIQSKIKDIGDVPGPKSEEAKNFEMFAGIELAEGKQDSFYNLVEALEAGSPVELKGYKEISMESSFGFKEILTELKEIAGPSKAYPNFNYHMGVACQEMGFIDEAIEQFQVAMEKGQNPSEAAKSLCWCYKEKGWWEEAKQALEKALEVDGITEEKTAVVKKELDLIAREIEREREILGGLNILSSDSSKLSNMKRANTGSGSGLEIQDALTT